MSQERLIAACQLIHHARTGVLATLSHSIEGHPMASTAAVGNDAQGQLILFLSKLAEHTRNLEADPRLSVLLTRPKEQGVHEEARLTIIGKAERLCPDAALIARLFQQVPQWAHYQQLPDFHFWRVTPLRLRLINGFGAASWIAATDYLKTAATIFIDHD